MIESSHLASFTPHGCFFVAGTVVFGVNQILQLQLESKMIILSDLKGPFRPLRAREWG